MSYKEIIEDVSNTLDLPFQLVDRAYRSYWRAVREYIEALPLKEDLTDEEFTALKPNINIPSLGKLYITLDRYRRIKKRYTEVTQKARPFDTLNE